MKTLVVVGLDLQPPMWSLWKTQNPKLAMMCLLIDEYREKCSKKHWIIEWMLMFPTFQNLLDYKSPILEHTDEDLQKTQHRNIDFFSVLACFHCCHCNFNSGNYTWTVYNKNNYFITLQLQRVPQSLKQYLLINFSICIFFHLYLVALNYYFQFRVVDRFYECLVQRQFWQTSIE